MKDKLGRLLAALEESTGFAAMARRWGATPTDGPCWWRVPGGVLVLLVLLQVATGIGLAIFYSPGTTTAWGSVFHIEERVLAGSFVRGLHAFGASAIVICAIAHAVQVGLRRGYAGPRKVSWILGLILVPVIATFALTGYLLPWDQRGYWATQVATGIMQGTPLVGGATAKFFQGGAELGNLTLTRFYAFHTIVLPVSLALLIGVHLHVWRRNAARTVSADEPSAAPYWPGQAFRDVVVGVVVLGLLAVFAATVGAGLAAPADPTLDYPARPEWYFAPMRELLKTIPEPVGSVILPGIVFFALASLPWLDRDDKKVIRRAVILIPLAAYLGLLAQTKLTDLKDGDYQDRHAEAQEEAALARTLARQGIPGDGAGEMLRRHPPRLGRSLFTEHCERCHKAEGKGGDEAPDLTGYLSQRWLQGVIREPQSPKYFGSVPELSSMEALPKEAWGELGALAAFVRAQDSSVKDRFDAATLERGRKAYFDLECNSCHQLKEGVADLGPNLFEYGSEAWLLAFLRDPGHELFYGEDNQMPANEGQLSETELQALVAYLQTLRGDDP